MEELTLKASIENVSVATDYIDARLEALDVPMKVQTQINVAIDEIVSNIASYAYAPGTGDFTVRFEAREEPRAAVITFTDSGMPFDPLAAEAPDVSLAAEDRKIGGLGIFLVKKIMDGVSYQYVDGKNILCIEKRF